MESRIKFTRYHGLDAFRCFAMLMGLVIHAPLVFEIPEIVGLANAYKYPPLAGIILSWIHSWRMPAFFILSGIFTQFTIANRGTKYFLFDRFIRILIPMVIVTTILNFFWDQSFQTLYHLWFLYYLFIVSVITVIIFFVAEKTKIKFPKIINFDRYFISLLLYVLLLFILVFLTSGARENGLKTDIPKIYADINLVSFLYHWFWFFLGQILYYNRKILDFELSKIKLFICFTLGITTHFSLLILVFEISFRGFYVNILSTVSTLIWILFFGGLFNKIFRKESKILNILLEYSYPIYLIHIAPSIIFGVIMYENGFDSLNMILPNIILSGLSSIVFYYIFIRYTPLSWFVNGYKKSWLRPF